MPDPTTPAAPANRPAPRAEPRRDERKTAPFDLAPSYLGRLAWLRALEADKKR